MGLVLERERMNVALPRERLEKRESPLKQKGHPKMGGRKKGTPNIFTRELKDALLTAAEFLGSNGNPKKKGKDGLVGYLTKVAHENPQVFCAMLGRLIPYQLQADMAVKHEHTHAVKFDFNVLVKRDPRELADLYFEEASAPAGVPEQPRPTSH